MRFLAVDSDHVSAGRGLPFSATQPRLTGADLLLAAPRGVTPTGPGQQRRSAARHECNIAPPTTAARAYNPDKRTISPHSGFRSRCGLGPGILLVAYCRSPYGQLGRPRRQEGEQHAD